MLAESQCLGGFYLCDTFTEVGNILDGYVQAGVSQDNIFAIYIVPKIILTDLTVDENKVWNGCPALNGTWTIPKISSLNGYIPKNNKLFCYPYTGLILSNNNGSSNVLRFEDFETSDCEFEVKGVATIGTSVKCSPRYYKNHGQGGFEEEGIIAGKFPTLGWSRDGYGNWLSQNAINVGLGVVLGTMQTVTGNVSEGLTTLGTTLKQVTEAQLLPNSSRGNLNAGDIQTASKQNTFRTYTMSIKQEYAKIIDNFFSMYGYLVNTVKIPNLNTRTNWNYIKTNNANLVGDIPQKDLEELKEMFNRGVTIWHNENTFLDYSQNNTIIS